MRAERGRNFLGEISSGVGIEAPYSGHSSHRTSYDKVRMIGPYNHLTLGLGARGFALDPDADGCADGLRCAAWDRAEQVSGEVV